MTYPNGRPERHGHRPASPNNGRPVYAVYVDPEAPPAPPVFPVGAMPRPCRELINQSAASIGCPPDFVGVGMLPTLGSAIGNARTVELKLGWEESPALYAVTIAEPGEKKSPAAKIAAAPAIRAQASLRREYRRKADAHKKLMRRYEVERKEAAKNGTPAGPPPEEPRMGRALVEDTTVEALAVVLEGTLRGVAVLSDELSAWVLRMNQYKKGQGADRQFWLSAWSNSYVCVDRKNRPEPLMIQRPFVTVFGTIQPGTLHELSAGREDGFLDRILLSAPEPIRSRWSDSEIGDAAREDYAGLYEKLVAPAPLLRVDLIQERATQHDLPSSMALQVCDHRPFPQ